MGIYLPYITQGILVLNEVEILRVISNTTADQCAVETNGYTPLIVEFENNRTSSPIYWRAGNYDTSLIGIGLNPNTGCFSSISLLMFDSMNESLSTSVPLIVERCMPVFDIFEWPNSGYLDSENDFLVSRNGKSIRFVFSEQLIMHKVFSNDNVDCCVDEQGELIWIQVSGLDKKTLNEI